MRILSPHCGVAAETTSGGESYERELLRRMAMTEDVRLLMTRRARGRAAEAMWTIGSLPINRGLKWWAAPFLLLDRMRDEPRPSILRVHSLKFIGPSALVARRFWPGVPLVAHHHHIDEGRRPIERFVSNRMDRVIVGSKFALRQMEARGWRTDHVRVIPYGVDSQKFYCGTRTRTEQRVLYFGGVKERKNLGALLDLWARVAPEVPVARLTIAGGGSMLDHYRSYVRTRKIPRVSFTGYVDEQDKPFLYRAADVFVFPSTLEGFGLPVLEAMASGLPCLVSDASDFRDWVEAPYALPLDRGTERQWAAMLFLLLNNRPLREVVGDRNRKFAETMTWEKCVADTLDVYREVLA